MRDFCLGDFSNLLFERELRSEYRNIGEAYIRISGHKKVGAYVILHSMTMRSLCCRK